MQKRVKCSRATGCVWNDRNKPQAELLNLLVIHQFAAIVRVNAKVSATAVDPRAEKRWKAEWGGFGFGFKRALSWK